MTALSDPPRMTTVRRRNVALVLGLAFSAGLLATSLLMWGRGPTVMGVVQSEAIAVVAPVAGRLASIEVQAGQLVSAGQVLFTVRNEALLDQRVAQQRRVLACQTELDRIRNELALQGSTRQQHLESERFETELKLTNYLQEQLDQEVRRLAWRDQRGEVLTDVVSGTGTWDGIVAPLTFRSTPQPMGQLEALLQEDAAANAAEALATRIALCRKRLASLDAALADLKQSVSQSQTLTAAEQQLAQEQAELARLEALPDTVNVTTLAGGVAGTISGVIGDHVQVGDWLMEVGDPQRRFVHAAIPADQVRDFAPGAVVDVVFAGERPYRGVVAPLGSVDSRGPATASHHAAQHETARSIAAYLSELTHPTGSNATTSVRILPTGRLWPDVPTGTQAGIRLVQTRVVADANEGDAL